MRHFFYQQPLRLASGSLTPARSGMLQRERFSSIQQQPDGVPATAQAMLRSPGQPLDPATRSFMEARFGHNFSRVRIHTDGKAAASAQAVNALAYTVGRDIIFGAGQYMPATPAGQQLLAHELTHVVQQMRAPGGSPQSTSVYELAEGEAQRSSHQILAAPAGQVNPRIGFSGLQRQDKGKKVSGGIEVERGFETKPKETKNKFSFDANLKLPVVPGLKLGSAFLLEDLKINLKGSTESQEPVDITTPNISTLQTQIALGIARLEAPKLKLPANLGQLSLGAKLGASGSLKQTLGPEGKFTPNLSTTASLETGFTPPELKLSTGLGEFTLGGKLGATGSLKQTFGEGGGVTPKLETKAGLETGFKSAALRSPVATLGGFLGTESRLTAGTETSFSAGLEPEKGLTSKLAAGGKVGLTGKGPGGRETFINIKISGNVDVDLKKGEIDASSQTFFVGASVGGKF